MGNTFNYNGKNRQFFFNNPVMKSERHISLAHLYLLSSKSDTLLFSFPSVWKLFCQSGLYLDLLFVILFWPVGKILFGKETARPIRKIICQAGYGPRARPGTVQTSSISMYHGQECVKEGAMRSNSCIGSVSSFFFY